MKTFSQFLTEAKQTIKEDNNDILKRIKILSKDSNYEDLEPVLYQSTRGGKDELVIYHNDKPIIPDDEYRIISYTNGKEWASDFASKNELEKRYNKFHSPKYLKDFKQNQKVYWKSPKLSKFKLDEADLGVVEPGLDKNDDEPYNTPLVKIDEDVKVLPSQNYDINKFNKTYKSFLNEAVEYVELPYLMRKPNDLEDLKRFHNKHKNDPKEKYMVVYTMELTNDEYNEWTGSFLGDFPFGKIFKKYGGTSKDGKTTEVVRVKSKNKPTLYVDPEGYDYARYVALEK